MTASPPRTRRPRASSRRASDPEFDPEFDPAPRHDGPGELRGFLCCVEVREVVRFHFEDSWRNFELAVFAPFVVQTRDPTSRAWTETICDPAVRRDRDRRPLSAVLPLVRMRVTAAEADDEHGLVLRFEGDRHRLSFPPSAGESVWRLSGDTVGYCWVWCRPGGRLEVENWKPGD